MQKLSSKWQKIILWLTGYLNIIAFVITGGYFYNKTQDEDVKKTAKTVFVLLVFFAALDILRMILNNIFYVAESYEAYNAMTDVSFIISIIKAIVFVVFCILDMCGIKILPVKVSKEEKEDIVEEQQPKTKENVEEEQTTEQE